MAITRLSIVMPLTIIFKRTLSALWSPRLCSTMCIFYTVCVTVCYLRVFADIFTSKQRFILLLKATQSTLYIVSGAKSVRVPPFLGMLNWLTEPLLVNEHWYTVCDGLCVNISEDSLLVIFRFPCSRRKENLFHTLISKTRYTVLLFFR